MTDQEINGFSRRITQAGKSGLAAITMEIGGVYLANARQAQQQDEYKIAVRRAERCVDSLISGLDLSQKISFELLVLYQYMKNELRRLRAKRDEKVILAIEHMLASLQKSFEAVASADTSGPLMGNTQKVYAGLTYGQGTLNELCEDTGNRGFLA